MRAKKRLLGEEKQKSVFQIHSNIQHSDSNILYCVKFLPEGENFSAGFQMPTTTKSCNISWAVKMQVIGEGLELPLHFGADRRK